MKPPKPKANQPVLQYRTKKCDPKDYDRKIQVANSGLQAGEEVTVEALTVYSIEICPKCKLLKDHLTAVGKSYREASLLSLIEDGELMAELRTKGTFLNAAPVICVNGEYYGPDKMFSSGGKLDEGKLRELL